MKHIYLSLSTLLLAMSSIGQTTNRLPLVEGFTSNTCPPCSSFNGAYTPILNANNPNTLSNPGVAVIKYQMDWPLPGTDPSNNGEADSRRNYYQVNSIPDWFIDAESTSGGQTDISNAQQVDAELEIHAAYTLVGNTITVDVSVIPLVDLGSGARLFIALANKSYNYTGGTNGETEFQHVFRKMLPAAGGAYLSALTANNALTHSETYTYNIASGTPTQDSYDFWGSDIEVIVFVQKINNKEILNATIATEGILGVEDGDSDEFGMIVFPNPAVDITHVTLDGNSGESVSITILDQLGKIVSTENQRLVGGRETIQVSTNNLSKGLYTIQVINGEKRATSQLMIAE